MSAKNVFQAVWPEIVWQSWTGSAFRQFKAGYKLRTAEYDLKEPKDNWTKADISRKREWYFQEYISQHQLSGRHL